MSKLKKYFRDSFLYPSDINLLAKNNFQTSYDTIISVTYEQLFQ